MNLAEYSKNIFLPFEVIELKGSKVIWLHSDFKNLYCPMSTFNLDRTSAEQSILENYAVSTVEIAEALGAVKNKKSEFFADRYGEMSRSNHGGSGRCGHFNGYIAKGIGKTPLVSNTMDYDHSNGLLSLRDAVIECITSGVISNDLPGSAVPSIAIIDTGFSGRAKSWNKIGERCAILLRPTFVRPAHFLRSIYFGDAGHKSSQQYQDALRVKEMFQNFPSFDLADFIQNLSFRFGALAALRHWTGRVTASNLTVEGKFVDFGTFRSVPSWNNFVGGAGKSFGKELPALRALCSQLEFYAQKYIPNRIGLGASCFASLSSAAFKEGFLSECAYAYVDIQPTNGSVVEKIINLYWNLFEVQQKRKVAAYGDVKKESAAWFGTSRRNGSIAEEILITEIETLNKIVTAGNDIATMKVARFLKPMKGLFHEELLISTRLACERYEQSNDPVSLANFIETMIKVLSKYPGKNGKFHLRKLRNP